MTKLFNLSRNFSTIQVFNQVHHTNYGQPCQMGPTPTRLESWNGKGFPQGPHQHPKSSHTICTISSIKPYSYSYSYLTVSLICLKIR